MKRILSLVLVIQFLLYCICNVNALNITDIKPDDTYISSLGRDTSADFQYIRNIAFSYSYKYIVKEEQYIDCVPIDTLFKNLSTPLTIEEIDSGSINTFTKLIGTKEYQNMLYKLKIFSGLCGIKAEFEPTAFFSIYRDIALIGGYVYYSGELELETAYWNYITAVEDMTKEVIPYETRLTIKDNIKRLFELIRTDTTFKIFIIKAGEIDSMFIVEPSLKETEVQLIENNKNN